LSIDIFATGELMNKIFTFFLIGLILALPAQADDNWNPRHSQGFWTNLDWAATGDGSGSFSYGPVPENSLTGVDMLGTESFSGGVTTGQYYADPLAYDDPYTTRHNLIAGYLNYLINDNLALDVAAGRTNPDIYNNQFSQEFFPASNFGHNTSTLNSERLFVSGNLNSSLTLNRFSMGARIGYLATQNNGTEPAPNGHSSTSYYDQTSNFQKLRTGVDLSYLFRSSLEPYVAFDYLKDVGQHRDFSAPDSLQKINDEYQLSAGLRYFLKNGFSSNLQFNVNKEREEIDFSSLKLLLRLDL
jgi:hypothetical protein